MVSLPLHTFQIATRGPRQPGEGVPRHLGTREQRRGRRRRHRGPLERALPARHLAVGLGRERSHPEGVHGGRGEAAGAVRAMLGVLCRRRHRYILVQVTCVCSALDLLEHVRVRISMPFLCEILSMSGDSPKEVLSVLE